MTTAGYSATDLAKLLGVSPAHVRTLVAEGFVTPRTGPRGAPRFSFQDLVVARTAQGLLQSKLPSRRVHEALRKLREQLPTGRSLAQMRIVADGGRIIVRDGQQAWEPTSGQTVLDFEVAALARRAAPIALRGAAEARRHEQELDAEDWFELALDLEATAASEAEDAYRRALALDAEHYDARLNLGRLRHEAGDLRAAEAHYRAAESAHPSDPTPPFNLGVALEDAKRYEEAAAAYQRAITADAGYADAYFNLSGVYEKLGRAALALRCLKTYRQLTRGPR
jgi:tetratricopeptide (TPR) repeat protein